MKRSQAIEEVEGSVYAWKPPIKVLLSTTKQVVEVVGWCDKEIKDLEKHNFEEFDPGLTMLGVLRKVKQMLTEEE